MECENCRNYKKRTDRVRDLQEFLIICDDNAIISFEKTEKACRLVVYDGDSALYYYIDSRGSL